MTKIEKRERIGVIRAVESDKPQIIADFNVFGDVYDMGYGFYEQFAAHAFDDSKNTDVRALVNHDTTLVLGRTSAGTLHLSADARALSGTIDINSADSAAMDLYARVKRGDVSGCSIGFEIISETEDFRDDGTVMLTITAATLYEVSVCTFPAYEATTAQARSRALCNRKKIMKARLSRC